MNFHYFVMVAIVALYQDWLPFALAIAFVLVHHGVIGTLEPTLVYDPPEAIAHPWRWSAVYAGFVAAISAVCVAGWRITQGSSSGNRRAESELMDEKRVVETLHSIGTGVVTELDLNRVAQLVTDAAVTAVGAEFGAFFYNVLDASGERHLLYSLSGVAAFRVRGLPDAAQHADLRADVQRLRVMRIDDVLADPRYGQNSPYHGMPRRPPAGTESPRGSRAFARIERGARRALLRPRGARRVRRAGRAPRRRYRHAGGDRLRQRASVPGRTPHARGSGGARAHGSRCSPTSAGSSSHRSIPDTTLRNVAQSDGSDAGRPVRRAYVRGRRAAARGGVHRAGHGRSRRRTLRPGAADGRPEPPRRPGHHVRRVGARPGHAREHP